MTVRELISVVAPNTNVRVRVLNGKDFSGATGVYKTKTLLDTLSRNGYSDAMVTTVHMLCRAQELYIECLLC